MHKVQRRVLIQDARAHAIALAGVSNEQWIDLQGEKLRAYLMQQLFDAQRVDKAVRHNMMWEWWALQWRLHDQAFAYHVERYWLKLVQSDCKTRVKEGAPLAEIYENMPAGLTRSGYRAWWEHMIEGVSALSIKYVEVPKPLQI